MGAGHVTNSHVASSPDIMNTRRKRNAASGDGGVMLTMVDCCEGQPACARLCGLEPGTDRIHIRLDRDDMINHGPEFWAVLSFSLLQLQQWLVQEGCVMLYSSGTTTSDSMMDGDNCASEESC
jgi:hypothetical protein